MEHVNDEDIEDDVDNSSSDKGSRESKRKLYPVRELKYIIDFVAKIYNQLGASLYHSREDIAKTHNLAVLTIKQVLSTAQQYALLDLKHGTGYKVSPLFVKIHKPLNEAEKKGAVIDSLKSCNMINKLLKDYEGHVVPQLPGITNNIVRTFDLKESLAQKVAEIFLSNLRDFSLIDESNNLSLNVETKADEKPSSDDKTPPSKNNFESKPEDQGVTVIPIPLKALGKKAYLHLPDGYTDADLNRIAKFVNALKDDDG